DAAVGFPDDTNASGPTLVSTATLCEVARWFGADLDEMRRRFRANLEIDGVPAFWEDQLIGVTFRLGEVAIEGVNPCARCAVPSRNSLTGEVVDPAFAKSFAERRAKALPPWADRRRFDHYYRLALNTRIPESEAGKIIRVGDCLWGGL
ncbi:MAG: MOSC domain-containing protein, partial [Acidobacteria bacterium]|nr:MOSC domain-containing protein [Acidobacteriota bacterium]